jgi:hypothetical protein
MRNTAALALTALTLSPTALLAAAEPPTGTITVPVGGQSLVIWPYTTSDLETPSDPVNLIFPGRDPREIRQELLKLDGSRPGFPPLPGTACRWVDAMGDEQAAWAETEDWVGGTVQLACAMPGAPLGNPVRFHVRLFRQGEHTLGGAHMDFLVPGTAAHELLSWDAARALVAYDMGRTGTLGAPPDAVPTIAPGSFRTLNRAVYNAIAASPGGASLLGALGLSAAGLPNDADVPVPTNGQAVVLAAEITPAPVQAEITDQTTVVYNVVVPRPFCATGPYDLVWLQGPVQLSIRTHTNPSGNYERTQSIAGQLTVTPMAPVPGGGFTPVGDPVPAVVAETHRAMLTDQYGEVTWGASQVQLGDPVQALAWQLAAGQRDFYELRESCGNE